jgi:hypothetical protein
MRKLMIIAAGAIILLSQVSAALAVSAANEGTCISRCYIIFSGPNSQNRCILDCISRYPKGVTETRPVGKEEILGDVVIGPEGGTHHRNAPIALGAKSGNFATQFAN